MIDFSSSSRIWLDSSSHRFGGVYLDADTIFLLDWEELWGWKGAFAYRWSRLKKYNRAVLHMNKGSALGSFLFRTALKFEEWVGFPSDDGVKVCQGRTFGRAVVEASGCALRRSLVEYRVLSEGSTAPAVLPRVSLPFCMGDLRLLICALL